LVDYFDNFILWSLKAGYLKQVHQAKMITIDSFQKMDDSALRKEVLFPLLKAMGYKDIHEYHGGSGEQGKDIVCWKPDELGSRQNLAIVVKATKMSGKARAISGAAGEVQTQIRQCFGSTYVDPVSGEEQNVHHVWVVSNKKISKEAIDAIDSAVADPDLMRHVRFIDSNKLWSLIEEKLHVSIWSRVEEVRRLSKVIDSHYEPQITIAGDKTLVKLSEKFPGAAKEKPISIKGHFVFPKEEDAKAFHASLQKHLETGAPFNIPSKFIGNIDIPDFVQQLIGVQDLHLKHIAILPTTAPNKIPVRITFVCEDGDNFVCNYVLLKLVKGGTKKITLVNDELDVPFLIKLELSFDERKVDISVSPRNISYNAVQYFDLLKLYVCLSKKVRIQVVNLNNGIMLFEMQNEQGIVETPSPEFVNLIRNLANIQQKTGKSLIMPKRDLTEDEIGIISEIHQAITVGRVEFEWNTFSATLQPNPENLETFVNTFKDGKEGLLAAEEEEIKSLFDIPIPLGKVRYIMQAAKLENFKELLDRYHELSLGNSTIELKFVSGQTAKVTKEYLNWLT